MRLAFVVSTLILAALPASAAMTEGDAVPACATQHEWQDLVVLGMDILSVRNVVDFHGVQGDIRTSGPHAGQYPNDWVCCPAWQPDKKARGWFDATQNILLDKNVIDQ